MSNAGPWPWPRWLFAGGAALLVAGAVGSWLTFGRDDQQPRDCALTPSALHQGTFLHWRLSMAPGEGMSGEVSAVIRLDDGREIIAYNVTNAGGLTANDRVTVSEIQCIHRRVFLLSTATRSADPLG